MEITPIFSFIQNLGATEIFVVFLIVLLLFGAKKLPELARGMGKAMKEFKNATKEVEDDFKSAMADDDKKTTASKEEEKGK